MTLALCGAHRTGKSTLAKTFSEKSGLPMLESQAGAVYKRMGFEVGQKLTPEQRLDIQEAILDQHIVDVTALGPGPMVSDRSPMDFAAYVLSELPGCKPETQKRAMAYINRCFQEANRRWSSIVLIQPGIPYVAAEGKPPPDILAQERMNAVLWGLLIDERAAFCSLSIPRSILTLEDRLDCLGHISEDIAAKMVKLVHRVGVWH